MANIIKYIGNTERFAGQTKGKLLSADHTPVKLLSPEMVEYLGEDTLPRGSCIICIFRGNKGVPFADARSYGSATLIRLLNSINQEFFIDVPPTETQENLGV